ncbi:DUF2269 family protein, partial [Pseudomonas aeruginosa]|uniref:DUF2269 family protein n=5 Tax=Pseudomonas aeruginosa TaxID=287 RepID=UPI000D6A666F
MEHFIQIKILHGVATVLLFGGLLGLAFYAWRSWRTGDAARVARGFKRVRLIGWPLLGLSLLALPVSGWWLAHLAGWPLGQSWLLFGACLYLLGCIFWLVLAGRLARVQHQAGAAETAGAALGGQALRGIQGGLGMARLGVARVIAGGGRMVSGRRGG